MLDSQEAYSVEAYSVEDFARRHGISRTTAYAEIKEGRLIARKVRDRTVVIAEDAREWRRSLPKTSDAVRAA